MDKTTEYVGYRNSEGSKVCDDKDPPEWKIYLLGASSLVFQTSYVFFFGFLHFIAWELTNKARMRGRTIMGLTAGELPPPRKCFTKKGNGGWLWLDRLFLGLIIDIFLLILFLGLRKNGMLW